MNRQMNRNTELVFKLKVTISFCHFGQNSIGEFPDLGHSGTSHTVHGSHAVKPLIIMGYGGRCLSDLNREAPQLEPEW